ncbi:MAG: tripartite tricarboxylate transporter substrate binding protein [Betaproteobacteria bacterium]|nr:tripartite tricarboxylate transporter substrate binding protein [Betaproteobacteria bacterium]MBI3936173.1 tripartite tricarboxylate transporter substrate binding protein [Betaproteobacteria bacterium]
MMNAKIVVVAAALTAICAAGAHAQPAGSYPVRPVRIVVPFAAGGNVDLVARAVSQRLSESLGQQVIVDNRAGASGLVGTHLVAKAAPDGYTLLAMANTFAVVPSILSTAGYDPLKDFAGVTQTCLVPQVLVVNPALPVRSVKELVALAKARPGQLSYASAGTGGTGHMAAELFNSHAGLKMLHVPYKGNAQAIVDVISGQVTMMFDQVSTSAPHIKAGKLRALAVTSLKRSPLFPDLPTVDEAGVRGYEDITFNGLVAPAGTPRDILVRLNAEVAKAVAVPELRRRFIQMGVELTASASPEAFTEYVRAEFVKKAKLAREAGIKLE